MKDGTKCFFAVDAHGNIKDYGSIWFTTKDGKTFRIVKTQCVIYKGISKSTNDIGASLGNPIYKKVEGLNVLKAFIEFLLTPISKIAASFLVYVIENMICNLTVVFDIVKLIVACDVKGLLQLVDTVALYMVGYNLVLFMLGTIVGLTSGVALAIAVAFGTAIFMILIDLAQIGFNLDLYMEQRGIDSYEELTGYFLAQVAEDAVYNFLLVNFMKFAKKAKIKIPSKVSNGVNKLTDKIKDAGNNVANKLDDMINKGGNGSKLTIEQINYYVENATNNSTSKTVVLGCTGEYDKFADNNSYTYFKMDDDIWAGLESGTKHNYDEIWKVNKQFIDNQIISRKEILLTNDPNFGYYFENGYPRFYQRELDYLSKDLGYSFIEIKRGLWKAIK